MFCKLQIIPLLFKVSNTTKLQILKYNVLKYVTFLTLFPHMTIMNQKQKGRPTEDWKCYFDLFILHT